MSGPTMQWRPQISCAWLLLVALLTGLGGLLLRSGAMPEPQQATRDAALRSADAAHELRVRPAPGTGSDRDRFPQEWPEGVAKGRMQVSGMSTRIDSQRRHWVSLRSVLAGRRDPETAQEMEGVGQGLCRLQTELSHLDGAFARAQTPEDVQSAEAELQRAREELLASARRVQSLALHARGDG